MTTTAGATLLITVPRRKAILAPPMGANEMQMLNSVQLLIIGALMQRMDSGHPAADTLPPSVNSENMTLVP